MKNDVFVERDFWFFAWPLKSIKKLRPDLSNVRKTFFYNYSFLVILFKLSLTEYTPDVFPCPVRRDT